MTSHPVPMRGGDEHDAFSPWRKFIRWKRGQLAKLKRRYWKRARKAAKDATKEEGK